MTTVTPPLTPARRAVLTQRSLLLAYVTAGYNLLEGVIAVAAGATASSVALLGFGLDSFIEVSSALVVIWQFRAKLPEAREKLGLKLIAASFFALAVWISVDSVRHLFGAERADVSPVGIGVAAASVVIMPLLVGVKRATGRELGSATVIADSMQTLLCTYLSGVVLAGLLLNWAFSWTWADPLAALAIAGVAVKEGVAAWRGEQCDDCALPSAGGDGACAPGCSDACRSGSTQS